MFDKALITESRYSSALKKDITPLKTHKESGTGLFAGSGGDIYDSDKPCPCGNNPSY